MILGILVLGQVISLKEVVEKIEKFQNYFTASHGGVTISGGEPLLQIDFLISLFQELKKRKIHTAIDTSRYDCFNGKIKNFN